MVKSESEIIKVCLKGAERGVIFSKDLDGMAMRLEYHRSEYHTHMSYLPSERSL